MLYYYFTLVVVVVVVVVVVAGAVKLVECRHLLPGLKTLPGRTSWKVRK